MEFTTKLNKDKVYIPRILQKLLKINEGDELILDVRTVSGQECVYLKKRPIPYRIVDGV
jgi:bifunctional DNA-binding transcriptional regulator/antitoxin component of YhaV-PrlF toxin-antitoxin module